MIRDQRGVAMVVVLLVGAALTVVSSTATFLTIQEFRASGADRTSTQALGYSEAGLDRMIQVIKTTPWDDLLVSGCPGEDVVSVEGEIGDGTFVATVTAEVDCDADVPPPFEPQFLTVRSEGDTADATRTVRQTLRVVSGGLPVGLYAYNFVVASGEGTGNKFEGISLITQGSVESREKLSFSGFDPWLSQFDVYGTGPKTTCLPSTGMICNSSNSLPAAVHAAGTVTCDAARTCSSSGKTEHVGSPDNASYDLICTANGTKGGTTGQSAWDGSARGGPTGAGTCSGSTVGKAPTSLFTLDDAIRLAPDPTPDKIDYEALKAAAQESGIYCSWNSSTKKPTCTKNGGAGSTDLSFTNASDLAGLPEDYIAYFDFPASDPQTVDWRLASGNCAAGRTSIMVVRNGNFDMSGGSLLAGAVLASDGSVRLTGGSRVHGTIIAKTIDARGDSSFKLDECAIKSLTAPFINVTPGQWSEIDRPQ